MRLTIVIIIILILMGLSYNAGLTENKLPDLTEPQFITIKGVSLNPDHGDFTYLIIVSFWKQNNTLHLMTDTLSTFRNGNRDNYYQFKLTHEEMEEYFYGLLERRM